MITYTNFLEVCSLCLNQTIDKTIGLCEHRNTDIWSIITDSIENSLKEETRISESYRKRIRKQQIFQNINLPQRTNTQTFSFCFSSVFPKLKEKQCKLEALKTSHFIVVQNSLGKLIRICRDEMKWKWMKTKIFIADSRLGPSSWREASTAPETGWGHIGPWSKTLRLLQLRQLRWTGKAGMPSFHFGWLNRNVATTKQLPWRSL